MTTLAQKLMTAEEFAVWSEARPEKHWELFDGTPQMRQSQIWGLARHVLKIYRLIDDEISRLKLPLLVATQGLVVKAGPRTAFEPDVVVFSGPIGDRDIITPDPIVVVEVLSPSTEKKDFTVKLAGYFDVPTIQHYVIVDWEEQEIIHYRREGHGLAKPDIVKAGVLPLEPPGLMLDVSKIFADA